MRLSRGTHIFCFFVWLADVYYDRFTFVKIEQYSNPTIES